MEILTNKLTGSTPDLLVTEIMFYIASAKSLGKDLLRLTLDKTVDDAAYSKRLLSVARILKSVKRKKTIQLFVTNADFEAENTEIEYLLNKYPALLEIISNAEDSFIIKL